MKKVLVLAPHTDDGELGCGGTVARLLEEGELSIDDICETVGVKDRFHFSRMFKRLHGLSPAAYRRGYRPR